MDVHFSLTGTKTGFVDFVCVQSRLSDVTIKQETEFGFVGAATHFKAEQQLRNEILNDILTMDCLS